MSDVEPDSLSLVDVSVLQGLKAYAQSSAFMPQIVAIFEEHGRSSMVELREAMEKQDLESVRRIAHRLKGSCLNIGAQALARELKPLEICLPGTELSPDQIQANCYDLSQIFEATCVRLKSLC